MNHEPRRAGMSKWQPIETAPKDGTDVWLYEGDTTRRTWRGKYVVNGTLSEWVFSAKSDDGTVWLLMKIKPTHWQPLPDPLETAA